MGTNTQGQSIPITDRSVRRKEEGDKKGKGAFVVSSPASMVSVSTYNWDLLDPSTNLSLPVSTNWVPILPCPSPRPVMYTEGWHSASLPKSACSPELIILVMVPNLFSPS